MVSVLNWTRKSNVDWPMPTPLTLPIEVLMQPMTNCTMTLLFLKDPGSICRGYFGHSNEVYISMDKHSISIDRISLWIHYIWPLLKLVAPIVLLRHIADMSCGKWGRPSSLCHRLMFSKRPAAVGCTFGGAEAAGRGHAAFGVYMPHNNVEAHIGTLFLACSPV